MLRPSMKSACKATTRRAAATTAQDANVAVGVVSQGYGFIRRGIVGCSATTGAHRPSAGRSRLPAVTSEWWRVRPQVAFLAFAASFAVFQHVPSVAGPVGDWI